MPAPANPNELNTPVVVYRNTPSGRNEHGQPIENYAIATRMTVKAKHVVAEPESDEHRTSSSVKIRLTGNWWDMAKLKKGDKLVVGSDGNETRFAMLAMPTNWEMRNRWGIVEVIAEQECEGPTCDPNDTPPPVENKISSTDQ